MVLAGREESGKIDQPLDATVGQFSQQTSLAEVKTSNQGEGRQGRTRDIPSVAPVKFGDTAEPVPTDFRPFQKSQG